MTNAANAKKPELLTHAAFTHSGPVLSYAVIVYYVACGSLHPTALRFADH